MDTVVHINALLPCAIVYWTLHDLKSAWLAVILYEAVCLVGLPLLTVYFRSDAEKRVLATRLRPLVSSLVRPHGRCALVTTGSLFFFGCGGFAIYLLLAQRELEAHGISRAIHKHSEHTGLGVESTSQAVALIFLGVWFCTVNPLLEELFWRGYCYVELSRLMSRKDREAARWLTSLYFASFHAVVVVVFVNHLFGFLTLAFLTCVSRAWIWLVETPLFGFPFVVAFHAGADVAVVLVFSALDFGWAQRSAYIAATLASSILGLVGAFFLGLAWTHDNFDCCLPVVSQPTAVVAVPLIAQQDASSPDSSPDSSPANAVV